MSQGIGERSGRGYEGEVLWAIVRSRVDSIGDWGWRGDGVCSEAREPGSTAGLDLLACWITKDVCVDIWPLRRRFTFAFSLEVVTGRWVLDWMGKTLQYPWGASIRIHLPCQDENCSCCSQWKSTA